MRLSICKTFKNKAQVLINALTTNGTANGKKVCPIFAILSKTTALNPIGITISRPVWVRLNKPIKPGIYKPQLPVERSVTLVSSNVVEQRCYALQVIRIARLQEKKET